MHVHILGIAGTFMGGLALLARELNFKVTGSDQAIYPPMSNQLADSGIQLTEGYGAEQLNPMPDIIVVGNVMTRGMPIIEAILNQGIRMISGPQFLAQYILPNRHVLAVSGTHGKTTTSSMLAWILEVASLSPGFLIGGIPNNFGISARLGKMPYFVLEADEYDSAFFDKRSKFIHYGPRTLIINNIEYDHADIFPNLAAIETQFHHLVRTIPGQGLIVAPENDATVDRVLKMGCWTPIARFQAATIEKHEKHEKHEKQRLTAKLLSEDGRSFEVNRGPECLAQLEWSLLGNHNVSNALAAMIAAEHVGVPISFSAQALCRFASVKRRLEIKGQLEGVVVYDDFAHHPTAIATTLAGLRAKVGEKPKIIAVLEMRSNTMRAGAHQDQLANSFKDATEVYFLKSKDIAWDLDKLLEAAQKSGGVYTDVQSLVLALKEKVRAANQDQSQSQGQHHIVFMSNGGFGGIQKIFLDALQNRLEAFLS